MRLKEPEVWVSDSGLHNFRKGQKIFADSAADDI
jgi:hypothetical protein